jgi:uncharacterized protein (DUF58 family)
MTNGAPDDARMAGRLRQWAESRLPALTRMKTPEALPVELGRKRIYILPTGFGIGFAVVLMVMLVGALNYANNSALLLTCLLGGVAANSMLVAFRNLDGLRLLSVRAEPVTAGDMANVRLEMDAAGRARSALRLDGYGGATHTRVIPQTSSLTELQVPTQARGWMPLPRLRIWTSWPFGLFRAWSWLHPEVAILVYPAPEKSGPPARGADDAHQRDAREGEELAGLREYRAGDPIKHIAWKLSARHHDLLVREMDRPALHDAHMLDWSVLHGLDHEQRIARLARWIVEAHAQGLRWTLRLPSSTLGPAGGSEHYHRCMAALALLP